MTNDISLFRSLLANECAFDSLFCNVSKKSGYTLYYNAKFSEDPVFNHIVLNESIFANGSTEIPSILADASTTANELSIRSTLFVEDFWKNSARIQQVAISADFRVVEQMNILSKPVEKQLVPEANADITVEETSDFHTWNEVFRHSYQIPDSWNEELIFRESALVKKGDATMILSKFREQPAACLLLKEEPSGVFGIYCVGTVPEMRSKGIARSMLFHSEELAAKSGCKILTLQTIASDNVTPMYLKMGYKQQYRRNVLEKI